MSSRIPGERLRSAASRYASAGLWSGVPLGASFGRTAARRGAASALLDGSLDLSFTDLEARVRGLAAGLRELGVRPGDAVAYQLPNWWEAASALLATVSLGAHAVPIVPILRTREIGVILRQTRPRVVLLPRVLRKLDFLGQMRGVLAATGVGDPALVVVRGGGDEAPGAHRFEDVSSAGAATLPPVDPDSLAVIIYTSGSTADPKGAMHTHHTVGAELESLVAAHGLGPADRVLMPSPLTHVSGVVHGILAPALLGTSAVLEERWSAGVGLADVARHRVTYMIGAPTFLQEMVDHPDLERHDLSSLRLFSCGGASVPPELIRLARERIPGMVAKRSYGSSEFPTIATTSAEDALVRGLDTEGRALTGVEIRICDPDGGIVPAGTEGEIRARGPECFLGYVDHALDVESFDGQGFFRTGDLGCLDAEGYLRVTGRVKDIIVRKGEKISAREVEDLLHLHPAVAEAALVPVADPTTGERACACVRTAAGAPAPTLEDIVAFLRGHDLTPQKLPEQLCVVRDFPRLPSGKINKRLLREAVERPKPSSGSGDPE